MVEAMRYKVLSLCVWIALSITLISSCAGVDAPDLTVSQRYSVSLSATSGEQTKVSLNGTSVGWEYADILQITAVSQSGISAVSDLSVYSINKTNDNIASFTGFVTMSEAPSECYFTHPAGNAMTVDPSKGKIMARFNYQDGTHKPFLYSKESYVESGISTHLKYAGAMLEVDVQVEGVCSLAFFGNQFEDMYPLYIDPSDGSYTKSDEMGYIIQVPVIADGKTYLCVPPVKLERGFSLILIDAQGHQMIRSFSDGITGGYDFSDKAGSIIPIAVSGEFKGFDVSYSDLQYGHTTKDGLLSGTSISFKMDKSGVPDTRIEEWGATLVDSKGNIVRKYTTADGSALNGSLTTLETVGEYKLLPAGEYIFSPYYKAYGQTVSLGSETVTIPDPGVKITLGGYTSYDKYSAGDINGANGCVNTTIYGVTASINVHSNIIDSYKATLDGTEMVASSASGSEVSFGSLTRTVFKSYPYKVTVNVGNLTFENSREFHITGLPMEAIFNSNPSSWSSSWGLINASFSNDHIKIEKSGSSAIRSPKFHVPTGVGAKELGVKTRFDGCGRNVNFSLFGQVLDKDAFLDIYFTVCPATQTSVVMGDECKRAHYLVTYKSNGYLPYSGKKVLNTNNPSMMYSSSNNLYDKAIYKIEIIYSE